jgi:hypothetical protein
LTRRCDTIKGANKDNIKDIAAMSRVMARFPFLFPDVPNAQEKKKKRNTYVI